MKKNLHLFLFAFLLALTTTNPSTAQDFAYHPVFAKNTPFHSLATFIDTSISMTGNAINAVRENAVSLKDFNEGTREYKAFSRVTKHFEREFKGATDVAWTKMKNGYYGSFRKDGLLHNTWYTNGGYLDYLMISYEGKRLPDDVKKAVADVYEDYSITSAQEVHANDLVLYIVNIESNRNIKQLIVCNGEVNVYKELKKGL